MREAGYEYFVIDDGWMTDQRESAGHIIVNAEKFPSGMKALGDYIYGLEEIGLTGKHRMRDLWSHRDLGAFAQAYTGKGVAAHHARVLLVE
ncbi:MAG: hypothetical protein WA960_21005 [Tunicatimonas sp.]